jgi:nucleoside-diphosphate-sugar epimerase
MRVLVTGATGFIGGALCAALAEAGHTVRVALRSDGPLPAEVTERVVVGDICVTTDWKTALSGVDAVVHAAARAHVLRDAADNASLYMATNAFATRRLAEAAGCEAVRRFVYVSSIKVNGEETAGHAYTPSDVPHPRDAYGKSKMHGEIAALGAATMTGMEAAIVRAPLVYGPGVRANFLRLLRWVDRERLLPFGAIRNERSLVSVWNLCDLLLRALEHPAAPGRVWMVSDGAEVSTPDLIRTLGRAMGRRVKLISVPVSMLHLAGTLSARRAEVGRLSGSLVVDISATRSELEWTPPVPLLEGLERTVAWYLSQSRSDDR